MSISNAELRALIRQAEDAGAQIIVSYDPAAEIEGRAIINAVRLLPTSQGPWALIGPGPMGAIAAAECLRAVLASIEDARLKPCDACGYERPRYGRESGGARAQQEVRCPACGNTTIFFYGSQEDARNAWNLGANTRSVKTPA